MTSTRYRVRTALCVLLLLVGPPAAAGGGPKQGRPVLVRVSEPGFRWLDAGVGVAVAAGLVLIVGGLSFAVRHNTNPRGRRRSRGKEGVRR